MEPAETHALSESQNGVVAAKIREQLARKRMSRQRLADEARISISTLEKALNGSRPFTLASIVRLETALGIALRPVDAAAQAEGASLSAPDELGGYSRAAIHWLEGDYLTLRPSFEVPGIIYAYRTEIFWDSTHLSFREAERLDAPFSQKGVVSVPSKSGHIYLHTNEQGQMRMAILGRPAITGEMYGLLTTLLAGSGSQLLPVAVPLALIPRAAMPRGAFGRISDADADFQIYRGYLNSVLARDFARMIVA
jgi:transcriptional regulator with XRE-family HTH domain